MKFSIWDSSVHRFDKFPESRYEFKETNISLSGDFSFSVCFFPSLLKKKRGNLGGLGVDIGNGNFHHTFLHMCTFPIFVRM